jgi:hypothetical protein
LLRQWGGSTFNFFEQFDELSDTCIQALKDRNINHYSDIASMNIREVQHLTELSGTESNAILRFASTARDFCMKMSVSLRGSEIKYLIEPVQKVKASSIDYKQATQAIPSFHLISYDANSGSLLCYRKIPPDAFRSPTSISAPVFQSVQVGGSLTILTVLVSTFVGLDTEMTHTVLRNADGSISLTENVSDGSRDHQEIDDNAVKVGSSNKPSMTNGSSKKAKKKRNRDENPKKFNIVTDEDGYKYRSLRDFMIVEEPNSDPNYYESVENYDPNAGSPRQAVSSIEAFSYGSAIISAAQPEKSKSLKNIGVLPNSTSFNPAAICSKRLKRTISDEDGAFSHDFRRSNTSQSQCSILAPESYSQLYDIFLDDKKQVSSPSAFNSSFAKPNSNSRGKVFDRSPSFESRDESAAKMGQNSFFDTTNENYRSSFFSSQKRDVSSFHKVPESAFFGSLPTTFLHSSQQIKTSFEGLLTNKTGLSRQIVGPRLDPGAALANVTGTFDRPDTDIWSSQSHCNRYTKADSSVTRPVAAIPSHNRRSSFLLPPDDDNIKFEDAF